MGEGEGEGERESALNLLSPSPPPFFFFLVSLSQLANNTKTNQQAFLYLCIHPLLEEIDEVTHIEQPEAIKSAKRRRRRCSSSSCLVSTNPLRSFDRQLIGFLILLVYVQ